MFELLRMAKGIKRETERARGTHIHTHVARKAKELPSGGISRWQGMANTYTHA